jgi:P-type Cu+ transporter
MTKFNLPVEGMTCASCVARVEKVLSKVDGINNVSVNFASEKVSFQTSTPDFDLTSAAAQLEEYGYKINIESEKKASSTIKNIGPSGESEDIHYIKLKNDFILSLIFSIPVFLISMLSDFSFFQSYWPLNHGQTQKVLLILSSPVVLFAGKRFFIVFWNNLKHFTAEMNSLVAIGSGSAYGYSLIAVLFPEAISSSGHIPHVYFETASVIITLILFGRVLEHKAKRKTGGAIKKLLELQPKTAILLIDGNEIETPIGELKTGDVVIIKPGGKIPADGNLVSGSSTVDESMLSGEAFPVEKWIGSKIVGGTINKNGSFTFRITAIGDNSVLGKIIKVVEEAQGSKAPIQKLADKIASIFVPVVVIIAIITFIGWLLLGNGGFNSALVNFVAVLIIACPCALGLATPTAIIVSTGAGAQQGILIKNGESLELAHRVTTVVLDKTGTITEGKPKVTDIILNQFDEKIFLSLLASIEKKSEHPISSAVIEYANERKIRYSDIQSFQSLTGLGLFGLFNDLPLLVGNKKLMEKYSITIDVFDQKFNDLSALGKTVLFLSYDTKLIGLVAIEDPIKINSVEAIKSMQTMGLNVIMITGDNHVTAKSIAERVGVDSFISEVLPHQKAEKIKELQKINSIVAMVGDGINDAPALAQADVGIAIGTGTDVAIESSQIILVNGNLMNVIKVIQLSHRTIKTIKQNLFWAFIYNIIGIPLAALGLLNPMLGALAMSFSSVSVISNSLRLKSKL